MKHQSKDSNIAVGDVVLIKSEDRNRDQWPMGIVERLFEGKDSIVRTVPLKSGRDNLEQAIQHLYPLELSCDIINKEDGEETNQIPLDPNAESFVPK